MFDFANIHKNREHHAHGIENAIGRGIGKKHGLLKKVAEQDHAPKINTLDSVDLQSDSRKILNDQIVKALNSVMIDPQLPIRDLDPSQFTPEAVANRILNFIGGAAEQRRSEEGDEAAADMLKAARSGIERGFAEAKDVLENLGVFQDQVKTNAEQTHSLLNNGMDDFDTRLAEGLSLLPEPSTSQVQFAHSTESYAERQSTELKIKTRDGDIVTINIEKSQDYSSSQSAYQDGSNQISSSEQNFSQSKGLRYTVEGNLDEDELKAIDDLVGEVKELSDNFFNGDSQAALHHAMDIGFDNSEIASFAVNMSHSQTTTATQTYAEVRDMNNTQSSFLPEKQLTNLLAPLADIMKDMRGLLGMADKLFDTDESHNDVKKLFDTLSLMDKGKHSEIDNLEDHSHQSFSDISQQLFSKLF